jgi:AraC-like DNA-binding protein
MEIRFASELTFSRHWHMGEHHHVRHTEIIIPVSGSIQTRIGDEVLDGRPGHVLMYPQFVPHEERTISHQPLKMLYFAFFSDSPPVAPFMRPQPDRRCEFLARWMLEVGRSPMRNLILQLLVHHYQHGGGGDDPLIAKVKAHVREHLDEPIHLADLADVAGISPYHFARTFHAAVGMSPMAYVRRQRVDAARDLLLTTSQPLRVIAPKLGFRDEFELSRVFKRETGTSPRHLREH